MNDLLRRAIAHARLTQAEVADLVGVDTKTVRRWLAGRTPYPRHRASLVQILGVNEADLWPDLPMRVEHPEFRTPEIVAAYPHRWAVPRTVWQQLFEGARVQIDILAYAGLFLAEDSGLLNTLADRARAGVTVRILLGNPESRRIAERGEAEGVGDAMAAKIRNALVLYQPIREIDGVELRLHDTTLYNSIYRADDELLANPHILGVPAAQAPVLHIRDTGSDGMFTTYTTSFEAVERTIVDI
ncbi:helix-turn-helix domain-containing protein [Actinomadura macra]|uniref:helix-turn-helix domain-containing protein n=1 Tax=Actinomadura macra TaxID=46164 RepID=UPI0008296AF8|nr:helix-turn-helix domain-containing protein [Actinomadura macra]